jgi:hypothetical protein
MRHIMFSLSHLALVAANNIKAFDGMGHAFEVLKTLNSKL